MSLRLSDEQELLKQSVREFLSDHAPVSHLREMRDTVDAVGFSRSLWKEMAELGWIGAILPEEFGGADLGYAELGIVFEEFGRHLAPYPLLSSVVLGAGALLQGGSEVQKKEILPGVCSGDTLLALAFEETSRFNPYHSATRATASGGDFVLSGEKSHVIDGHVADHLIVAARTSGEVAEREGITLFLLDAAVTGLECTRTTMVDSRNAARLELDGVEVEGDRVLGEVGRGADILDRVLDCATLALSCELLGISEEVFDRTTTYLKTREQFGQVIGSFQGLKHRAAQMFCEVELCQAIVLDGLRALDEERPYLARIVSAAKARCSDTASLVTCEGVQMHGGIGMTDEEEIGLFLKRAKSAELSFGDASYHRDRFARLTGF